MNTFETPPFTPGGSIRLSQMTIRKIQALARVPETMGRTNKSHLLELLQDIDNAATSALGQDPRRPRGLHP